MPTTSKQSQEKAARHRRRVRTFRYAVLAAAAGTGLILAAAMIPNALQLLRFLPGMKGGGRFNYEAKRAATRLKEKGLIEYVERDGKWYARATEKGRSLLEQEALVEQMAAYEKVRWDKRWRVVIFDIPERRRFVRDRLRALMRKFSFARLQDSVWVYPHDCEEIVSLIKAELRVGAGIQYLIVESIENDRALRAHFGLKN